MRTFVLSAVLGLTLAVGCSKGKPAAAPTTPSPAPAAAPAPQGIAVGEPNPADPNASARPASVTDADVALADKLVDTMAKLSAGVVSAGSDCAQAATEIRVVTPEIKAVIAESQKMNDKLKNDAAAKAWFEKTYEPKVQTTMGKLMASPCVKDPAVQEAMNALN
jgi:hypothetical protein